MLPSLMRPFLLLSSDAMFITSLPRGFPGSLRGGMVGRLREVFGFTREADSCCCCPIDLFLSSGLLILKLF